AGCWGREAAGGKGDAARTAPSEARVTRPEALIAAGGRVDGERRVAGRVAQRLGRRQLAIVAGAALVRSAVGSGELEREVRDLVGVADEVGAGVEDERRARVAAALCEARTERDRPQHGIALVKSA